METCHLYTALDWDQSDETLAKPVARFDHFEGLLTEVGRPFTVMVLLECRGVYSL